METRLKVGDWVRCMDDNGYGEFTNGYLYPVVKVEDTSSHGQKAEIPWDSGYFDRGTHFIWPDSPNDPGSIRWVKVPEGPKQGDGLMLTREFCEKAEWYTFGKTYRFYSVRSGMPPRLAGQFHDDDNDPVDVWVEDILCVIPSCMVEQREPQEGDRVRIVNNRGWGLGFEEGQLYSVEVDGEPDSVDRLCFISNAHPHYIGEAMRKVGSCVDYEIIENNPPGIFGKAPEALVNNDLAIDGAGYKCSMDDPTKLPMHLIPPAFIEDLAAVLQHGAKKYAPNNWMKGMSWETVMSAVQRHIQAWRAGEDLDPESKLSHLMHAACGLMFLHWYSTGPHKADYGKFDDRVYKDGR